MSMQTPEENLCRDLGSALRRALSTTGWSVQRLADHLGLSPSTLYRWRNGKCIPRADVYFRVCNAIGKDFSAIWDAAMETEWVHAQAAAGDLP